MDVTETLPILYLLKWCVGLFLTMLPSLAALSLEAPAIFLMTH